MPLRLNPLTLAVAATALVYSAAAQTPAPSFTVGQAVEAREGDVWSKAKVTAREGRRIQIQYDDGTQEWVTADRLRVVGAAGDASPTTQAVTPDAPKAAVRQFAIGTPVEAKWGGLWSKGKVTNRRGEWHLVTYDSGGSEWVEPWRLRKPGDASYEVGYASPNRSMHGRIENPPTEKPGPAPSEGNGSSDAASAIDWTVTDVDLADATPTTPSMTPWAYKAAERGAAPPLTDRPIALQGGVNDVFERTKSFDINGNLALVSYLSAFEKPAYGEIVQLGAGTQIARAEFGTQSVPDSVSGDGKRVAAKSDGKSRERVDVWDVLGKQKPKLVVSFLPYGTLGRGSKDVERAFLVDATHLVTVNRDRDLLGWEIGSGTAKAVWHMKLDGWGDVAFSPDRKAIATLWEDQLLLVDALTGSPLGTADTTAKTLTSISFRGDGKRLVALGGPTLYAFDLEQGKQIASLGLPRAMAGNQVCHLGGDHVWISATNLPGEAPNRPGPQAGPWVIDVTSNSVLGQYKMPDTVDIVTSAGDRLVATLKGDGRRAIGTWQLPAKGSSVSAKPLPTISNAAKTKVAIDLQIEADESVRQAVSDSLKKQIAAHGWTLNSGTGEPTLRIVARTEIGRTEERQFGNMMGPRFGPFAETEKVTVTEKITRLDVEVDGKSIWQTRTSVMPSFVQRKKDQSIADAVHEAEKFDVNFLKGIVLPQTLFQPIDGLPDAPTFTLAAGGVKAEK